MRKGHVTTTQSNRAIVPEIAAFLRLKSSLRKKVWYWVGAAVTYIVLVTSTDFHFTTTTFIFAPFLSVSVGCWLLSLRGLVLCTRFLKPRIKNEPKLSLKQHPVCDALKIIRRCLHQFCLSNSFVIFAAIAFSANRSGALFHHFFYNLTLLTLFSCFIYGISLLFTHAQLAAVLGHPILAFLSSVKPMNKPADIPIFKNEFDYLNNVNKVHDDAWERWMHDPMSPASAEYQSTYRIWNNKDDR